jgi:predicted phosphodiesterase
LTIKLCSICGQEFDAYRDQDRYCGDPCRGEAKRRRERKFALPPIDPPTFVRKEIKRAADGTRLVIVSDLHYPFHDQRIWGAVTRFIDDFNPNVLVWNGDVSDVYSLSVFNKNPLREFTFAQETNSFKGFLTAHRERWNDAEQYYIYGNHEDRWDFHIARHTPELAGLISFSRAIGMDDLHISTIPYGGLLNYLGFAITHGSRISSLPSGTARAHAISVGGSGVVGHSHRVGCYSFTDLRGQHAWLESGCLCRLDPDWVKQRPTNWQHGFVIGSVYGNKLYLTPIYIYAHGFSINGEFYKA